MSKQKKIKSEPDDIKKMSLDKCYGKEEMPQGSFDSELSEVLGITIRKDEGLFSEGLLEQLPIDEDVDKDGNYKADDLTRHKAFLCYQKVFSTGVYRAVFDESYGEPVCSWTAFRNWRKKYPVFDRLMKRAKEMFRVKVFTDNPDLYYLAIQKLLKHLDGIEEQWIKVREEGGKKIKTVQKTKRPPSKWAIEAVLGLQQKNQELEENKSAMQITEIDFG